MTEKLLIKYVTAFTVALMITSTYMTHLIIQNEVSLPPDSNEMQNGHKDSETDGWKTYRNEEFGFEFRYPGDWVSGQPNRDDLLIQNIYLFGENIENTSQGITINGSKTSPKYRGLSPEEVIELLQQEIQGQENLSNNFSKYYEYKVEKVGEQEVIGLFQKNFGIIGVSFIGEVYTFNFSKGIAREEPTSHTLDDSLFKDIVSTFRFISKP